MAEHFNRSRKILQLAAKANTLAFSLTSKEFNNKKKSEIIIGDLVFVKTTQRRKMHHKLANTYKSPYMLYIFSDLYDIKKRAGVLNGFSRCHLPVLSKNTCQPRFRARFEGLECEVSWYACANDMFRNWKTCFYFR